MSSLNLGGLVGGPAGGRCCICIGEQQANAKWHHGCQLECNVISGICLRQLMHIYLKNNPARFHRDSI